MFVSGSRYEDLPLLEHVDATGRRVLYVAPRVPGSPPVRRSHIVAEAERLDHIAHRHFRAPERFWRICDANGAVRPWELLEPGGRLGIPGARD